MLWAMICFRRRRLLLLALGYTQAELAPMLKKSAKCKTVEEIIKFALKEFAKR